MSQGCNSSDINQTFIIESGGGGGNCTTILTDEINSCTGDAIIDLSVSGQTSFNTSIITSAINLGLDSSNELRILTADSSVLENDILDGGTY